MAVRPKTLRPALAAALASALAMGAALASDHSAAPGPAQALLPDSIAYDTRVADGNLVGTTLSNFGFIGNNFATRDPSLEYPLGSGFEHLTHGGLWIGALAIDDQGAFTGVTTALVDINIGGPSPPATEFTPAGLAIERRSRILSSPFYTPDAVSDLDFISTFSDRPARTTQNNPEPHRPLNVLVRQENYSWNSGDYQDVLFFHFVITNLGPPLQDAWVGFYTEFASGPKNLYSTWPPSSGGSTVGGWFTKKWIAYDESHRLSREHYCARQPIPQSCNEALVPPWIGLRLLGANPGDVTNPLDKRVTFAAWSWSPGSPFRNEDSERYAIMSAGTIQPVEGDSLLPGTGDPVELLAVGPFPMIPPGDSIRVDFALVGGADIEDLQHHAVAAQTAYDMGYRDVAVPVLASLVSAQAEPGQVRLVWEMQGASLAGIERRQEGTGWSALGEVQADGSGRFAYEDRDATAGTRYGYRLRVLDAGQPVFLGEVWVDVPVTADLALAGFRSNPVREDLRVAFSLPDASPARLELFDAGGRRIVAREVGTLGAGSHVVTLGAEGRLSPGVYLLRLSRGSRSLTARAVVLR